MEIKEVKIEWSDSYGVSTGWEDISDYSANELIINSYGVIVYEDSNVIAVAHNYSKETEKTPKQANGIMVIPKACIKKITSYASCQELE